MQLNQALDQGEAEPGAGFARLRIAALEFLENPLAIGNRDPDTGIGNRKDQIAVIDACFKPDRPAGRGEFDRVRNQVENRLFEPPFIGLDRTSPGGQLIVKDRFWLRARSRVSPITDSSMSPTSIRPVSSAM